MNRHEEARATAIMALKTPPPVAQFLTPLQYILTDHFRQRTLCQVMEEFAEGGAFDEDKVGAALHFMMSDFSLHVIDEEEDLFPLLRQRAMPEDDIEEVLDDLSAEHATDRTDADDITGILRDAIETGGKGFPGADGSEWLRRFAKNERRHLIVENAIVMPLARARLSAADLRSLGRRMAARRGIEYPGKVDVDQS
ncbi:hemerythrin domain-containing protein [Hoeflea prorocentri]|uniref:Hemerythrin domain-containing protein n=1 Tax=Hoeflea prorocentri TaxID=1922333 RepID=A0A9X3UJA7_9HYPH|nr:hemerythrin domain-containing protein [Hoeflea prorocentri]MCY6380164.1 hemerythrin domain-containing protein [Hoeflea prorocentri]MDA5397964.1 hemerythrin domain-containing protein [Hoeflea prorocentri]